MPRLRREVSSRRGQLFLQGVAELFRRDHPSVGKGGEDGIPAAQGRFRIAVRPVDRGAPEHAHEQGGLGEGDFRGGLGKIDPGRRLHPPDVSPEGRPVQVQFENAVLGKMPFCLRRGGELEDFCFQGPLPGFGKAHELAGDGGSAGDHPAGPGILDGRPEKGDPVDPAVLPEAPVLHLHGHEGQPFSHGAEGNGDRPFRILREKNGEDPALSVEQHGRGRPAGDRVLRIRKGCEEEKGSSRQDGRQCCGRQEAAEGASHGVSGFPPCRRRSRRRCRGRTFPPRPGAAG